MKRTSLIRSAAKVAAMSLRILFMTGLVAVSLFPSAANAQRGAFQVDDGPATSAGKLDVRLDWTRGGMAKSVPTTIAVAKDDTRATILGKIRDFYTGNADAMAAWDFSAAADNNNTKIADFTFTEKVGTTFSGAFEGWQKKDKATDMSAGLGKLQIGQIMLFDLYGDPGRAGDTLDVNLSQFASPPSLADINSFSLASYAGLSANDAEVALANMIGAFPGYSAEVINQGTSFQSVRVSGLSAELSLHVVVGSLDPEFDPPTLTGGVLLTQIPEPSTIALLFGGIMALGVARRLRLIRGRN